MVFGNIDSNVRVGNHRPAKRNSLMTTRVKNAVDTQPLPKVYR